MSIIEANPEWSDVPQIEVGDRVRGGKDGPANKQAQALANRTEIIKSAVLSYPDYVTAEAAAAGLPDGQVVEAPNSDGRLSRFEVQSGTLVYKSLAADAESTSFTPAGAGAVMRTAQDKMRELVSVKDFGAVGDDVTDDTGAIQAAINKVHENGGGGVFVPTGVYRVSQITIKTGVSIIGNKMENGWARLTGNNYDVGSVIKSLDNSGLSPVVFEPSCQSGGLQNLVVDANGSTQSVSGVHCLELPRYYEVRGASGLLLHGLKLVNPSYGGFGGYFNNLGPADFNNCFFMSGIFLNKSSDVNISSCSIDGTGNIHPSLYINESNYINCNNNLIWRSEAPTSRVRQAYTINVETGLITVYDGNKFYDDMPITLNTDGVFPGIRTASGSYISAKLTYFVKKAGGNSIELYKSSSRDYIGAPDNKIRFVNVGTGTQAITSGSNTIVSIHDSTHIEIGNNRIAGSPQGCIDLVRSRFCQLSGNQSYFLNFDEASDVAGIMLTGCSQNIISNSIVGDAVPSDRERIAYGIHIENDSYFVGSSTISEGNIITGCMYNQVSNSYVLDESTATYLTKNVIAGWDGQYGLNASRINSKTFRSQPGWYYYQAIAETLLVPQTTEKTVAWTSVTGGNPRSISNGSSLSFPMTAGSVINVKGQVAFTNRPSGAWYILVYVYVNGLQHRHLWEMQNSFTAPGQIIVPFDVTSYVGTDASVSVSIWHNAGSELTLETNAGRTKLFVQKVADYQAP